MKSDPGLQFVMKNPHQVLGRAYSATSVSPVLRLERGKVVFHLVPLSVGQSAPLTPSILGKTDDYMNNI